MIYNLTLLLKDTLGWNSYTKKSTQFKCKKKKVKDNKNKDETYNSKIIKSILVWWKDTWEERG